MIYRHGPYITEVPTSVLPPVTIAAGLPVFIGRAPINLAKTSEYVNKPFLASTYDEAVAALGYSADWQNYELCEAMYVFFQLFAVSPIVLINVLDPATHKKNKKDDSCTISDGKVIIEADGVLLPSVSVKLTAAGQALEKDKDYTAAFNDAGKVVITPLEGGVIGSNQATLLVSYDYLDPSMVTETEIIGGVSVTTGKYTGMELVNKIFPLFQMVPGQIVAPGWSQNPIVAAIMKAKVQNINGVFKAIALCDLDSSAAAADIYSEAPAWKDTNNYTDKMHVNCWPLLKLSSLKFRFSTQLAAVICRTDATNGDIPFWSPSNQSLQANGTVNAAGEDVDLDFTQANYLNGQGIVTAINFVGGWKVWGNRTGCYPSITDPKDSWIPVRRMFNWVGNTIILTYLQKVDNPTNKRLIKTIVDSLNIWLNAFVPKGALLGGRVEFIAAENPDTDLMNGINRFHVYLTPPVPGEVLEFILEFDVSYLETLKTAA